MNSPGFLPLPESIRHILDRLENLPLIYRLKTVSNENTKWTMKKGTRSFKTSHCLMLQIAVFIAPQNILWIHPFAKECKTMLQRAFADVDNALCSTLDSFHMFIYLLIFTFCVLSLYSVSCLFILDCIQIDCRCSLNVDTIINGKCFLWVHQSVLMWFMQHSPRKLYSGVSPAVSLLVN